MMEGQCRERNESGTVTSTWVRPTGVQYRPGDAGLKVSMTMHNAACLHPLFPFLRAFLPDMLHLESSSI